MNLKGMLFSRENQDTRSRTFSLLQLWKGLVLSPLKKPWVEMERPSSFAQLSGEMSTAWATLGRHSLTALPPPLPQQRENLPGTPVHLRSSPGVWQLLGFHPQMFWSGGSDTMPLLVKPLPLLYNLFSTMVVFIVRSSVNCDAIYNLS